MHVLNSLKKDIFNITLFWKKLYKTYINTYMNKELTLSSWIWYNNKVKQTHGYTHRNNNKKKEWYESYIPALHKLSKNIKNLVFLFEVWVMKLESWIQEVMLKDTM